MRIRRVLAASSAVVIAATSLAACSSGDSDGKIVVGTTDAAKKAWSAFEDEAEAQGLDIEVQNFSDYNTPNQALDQGELDTNNFQHLKFLAEFNKGNGTDLVPIVATEIVPLALFWQGHDSLDGIEGQEVAIPNDATNQGRAINLLAANDLVTLQEKGKLTPDPADIDEAKSKVKVTPVDASQTPSAYGEGTPAIITNSFFKRAGINPAEAVLYDDPEAPSADPTIMFDPYINVWAVQEKDKDNDKVKRLAQLYLSPEVKKAVQETTGGTTIFVDRPQNELQEILDRLETSSAE